MKFLVGVLIALLALSAGEYVYFTRQTHDCAATVQQWQEAVQQAKQATNAVQIQLTACQNQPDTAELIRQLTACKANQPIAETAIPTADPTPLPKAEYAAWPEFLRPDSRGIVKPVRDYLLSKLTDLNAFRIVSYHPPLWSKTEKQWTMTVNAYGRTNDGTFHLNLFEFTFDKDGNRLTVTETTSATNE